MQVKQPQKPILVSGIDWMISYVHWRSRSIPERDNFFCIFLEVSDDLFGRMEYLCRKEALPEHVSALLGGELCRQKLRWLPVWKKNNLCGSILSETIEYQTEIADTPFFNQPLPPHTKLLIRRIRCGEKKYLVYKFSHLLFDGIGAELFIRHHLQGDFDSKSVRDYYPHVSSWPQIAAAGKKLKNYMQKSKGKKIVLFPFKNHARASSRIIAFSKSEFDALKAFAEKKYGPYSFSLWLSASILCFLNDLIEDLNLPGDYITLPMSVDHRIKNGCKDAIFFNQWSIMPLLISRSDLHAVDQAFSAIRNIYLEALADHVPEMFFEASCFMRCLPYRIIDLFVRASPGSTAGTAMFSYLPARLNVVEEIKNAWHQPVIPPICPLGIFAYDFGSALNIVIMTHDGEIPEIHLDAFRRKIEKLSVDPK